MVDLSGWFLLPVIRFTASIDSNETESSSPFILHWEARLISHSSVWHWHHIVITTEGSSKNFLPTCFQIWLWAHFQKDHFYFLGKIFLSPNSVWVWYIYIMLILFAYLVTEVGKWCHSLWQKGQLFAGSSKPCMFWWRTHFSCLANLISSPLVSWLFFEYPRCTARSLYQCYSSRLPVTC